MLVTGEAGIGKSRLVRDIARAASARRFTVLTGRAVAGGVPTPFRPFAEALVSAGRAGHLPVSADLDPFRSAADLRSAFSRIDLDGEDELIRAALSAGVPAPRGSSLPTCSAAITSASTTSRGPSGGA